MKKLFLVMLFLFAASATNAATYTVTITTTTAQENRLTLSRTVLNAATGTTYANNDAMVQDFAGATTVLQRIFDQALSYVVKSIALKANGGGISPTMFQTACTDLGGTTVNGLCQ